MAYVSSTPPVREIYSLSVQGCVHRLWHTATFLMGFVRSLGWEDPLEKGKATHSGILAWRILGLQRLHMTKQVSLFFRRTVQVFLNVSSFKF